MEGLGEHHTCIITLSLKRECLSTLLPDELVFIEECPLLVLSFGCQNRVRPSFVRHTFFAPVLSYYEFIIAITGVSHRDIPGAGPFIFMPRLYLDKWIPIVLGYLYGFDKVRASIRVTSGEYMVSDSAGIHTLVALRYRPLGLAGGLEVFPELVSSGILNHMAMPLLGKTFWGSYLVSRMDWGLPQATFQPVSAELSGEDEILPGFPYRHPHITGIGNGSAAFRLHHSWKLTLPQPLSAFR